jgi:transcriptional regulator with XRE-family HTH domain
MDGSPTAILEGRKGVGRAMDQATGPLGRYLDDLRSLAGLDAADIADLAAVPEGTVSLWRDGAAEPDVKTRLLLSDLRSVASRLQEYYTAMEIRAWLYARHPQLEGRAIDEISEGRLEDVLHTLDRLDAAIYL